MNKARWIETLKELAKEHPDSTGLNCAIAVIAVAPKNLTNYDKQELFKALTEIIAKEVNLFKYTKARELLVSIEVELRKLN